MIRHKQVKTLGIDYINKKLDQFFEEDNISKDITTLSTQSKGKHVQAVFIAKEDLVFVGKQIISQGLKECNFKEIKKDGTFINKGEHIAKFSGPIAPILKKERVVLNLIQRLSGIASTTKKLAEKTNNLNIQLLDTRKTTPGLRRFEKFAVYVGGGTNHRFSLKDAVMIKDNHLIGTPSLSKAVESAAKQNPGKDIEVEVDTKAQLREALETRATSILLDNFSPETLPDAINYIRSHKKGLDVYVELSGGINENNIDQYNIQGVDGISIGALTHNITSKDISLDLK